MPKQVTEECLELIHSLIEDVDKCIIDDIRRNHERDSALVQLDILEKVRERLNARLDSRA